MTGFVFDGQVIAIERGKTSKQLLYRVRYSDSDQEHLTLEQVKASLAQQHGVANHAEPVAAAAGPELPAVEWAAQRGARQEGPCVAAAAKEKAAAAVRGAGASEGVAQHDVKARKGYAIQWIG